VSTPAGWYPDPGSPTGAGQRWWDGTAWTAHVAPGAPVAPVAAFPGAPDPVADLAAERSIAHSARTALVGGAIVYSVQFLLVAIIYHVVFHNFLHQVSTAQTNAQNGTTTTSPIGFSGELTALSGILQLAQLGLLAVGVIFLVWVHRAASVARNLGLPARHSPGMAVGGFLIPIVNLWFPYQAVVDMVPHDHPERGAVLRWWLLWLCVQFSATVIAVAGLISVPVGIILALGGAGLAVLAARAARDVVALVEHTHARLLGLPD
jgi:hypothetical protein